MAIDSSTTAPAAVEQVVATFTGEDFIRHVTHRVGRIFECVQVDGNVPPASPSPPGGPWKWLAAGGGGKFVGSSVHSTPVNGYSEADETGICAVRTNIRVTALPSSGAATQVLRPQGEHTDVFVDNSDEGYSDEAHTPFIGKEIVAAELSVSKELSL